MNISTRTAVLALLAIAGCVGASLFAPTLAAERGGPAAREPGPGPTPGRGAAPRPISPNGGSNAAPGGNQRGFVFDRRFDHNRYYPQPGFATGALPRGYLDVPWRDSSYYFYGGAWYRPYGSRFLVVRPPLGIDIPLLPPGYTTIWIGNTPYYYADGTYYLWEPVSRNYVVTAPPTGAEARATTSPPASEELFAYPKNGQSEVQQSTDRYECHDWARGQTGFDPTQPLGGVTAVQADSKRADYQRAQKACLEARGYSVR